MRDWLIFRYDGRYYQSVAMPFRWRRSPLWFTQRTAPLIRYLREHGYRMLAYLDDFLIATYVFGVIAGRIYCRRVRRVVTSLLKSLGLRLNPPKGCWDGSTELEHLSVLIDNTTINFFVAPRKLEKMQNLSNAIL